ncbi:GM21896 [Drosophila sechellia]|uniref:GM21896 n=1 Tax=Drosophila sechellia TaxID=7238 RepID=B4HNQ8_DROSE|nr:GM21896 [Drosophila sechellia]
MEGREKLDRRSFSSTSDARESAARKKAAKNRGAPQFSSSSRRRSFDRAEVRESGSRQRKRKCRKPRAAGRSNCCSSVCVVLFAVVFVLANVMVMVYQYRCADVCRGGIVAVGQLAKLL